MTWSLSLGYAPRADGEPWHWELVVKHQGADDTLDDDDEHDCPGLLPRGTRCGRTNCGCAYFRRVNGEWIPIWLSHIFHVINPGGVWGFEHGQVRGISDRVHESDVLLYADDEDIIRIRQICAGTALPSGSAENCKNWIRDVLDSLEDEFDMENDWEESVQGCQQIEDDYDPAHYGN